MLGDRRGVSNVLGFVLMFSLVVTTFAIYQADVIPHQNRQTEFDHSTGLDAELESLRDAIVRTGTSGAGDAVRIQTGTTYPARALGINPPDPTGRVRTTGPYQVKLHNLESVNGDFWTNGTRTFETRFVEYRPQYNVYRHGPRYAIETGMIVQWARNEDRRLDDGGALVSEDRITVPLVAGDYSEGGIRTAVGLDPISSASTYHTVRATNGNPYIRLPTSLPESEWQSYVASKPSLAGVHNYQDNAGVNRVTIGLTPGETYRLRVLRVGLQHSESPPVAELTARGATTRPLNTDRATEFEVVARDEYGNPVPGRELDVTATAGGTWYGTSGAGTVTTDGDGVATFAFEPGVGAPTTVTAELSGGGPSVSYTLGTPTGMTVMTPNQLFGDVGSMDEIVVENGRMVPATGETCLLLGDSGGLLGDVLGTLTCIESSRDTVAGDLEFASAGTAYRVQFELVDADQSGTIGDDGDDVGVVRIATNHSSHPMFRGELTDAAADRIVDGGETDLLSESNYDSYEWGEDDSFLGGSDDGSYSNLDDEVDLSDVAEIYVNDVRGRFTLNGTG